MPTDHPVYTFDKGHTITPIRLPCRMAIVGRSGSGKQIDILYLLYNSHTLISGKSYAIERMIKELPFWFGNTLTCVYYLYPDSGGRIGGLRQKHITALRNACDKYDVGFQDEVEDLSVFLKRLEDAEVSPRLVIVDGKCYTQFL